VSPAVGASTAFVGEEVEVERGKATLDIVGVGVGVVADANTSVSGAPGGDEVCFGAAEVVDAVVVGRSGGGKKDEEIVCGEWRWRIRRMLVNAIKIPLAKSKKG
jgi:hypothetical protein